ncbi:MAG: hypothetical protein WBM14_11530 [Terracidiphilus sp.]|jgi:hypothetical protein
MKARAAAILLSLLAFLTPLAAAKARPQVVFSAKVIRIEPWGPIKITCGIALVTRMAEYEVRTVYRGHIETKRVIVRHIACNYNELDDLKPGDNVIVVATKLAKPEKRTWMSYPIDGDAKDAKDEVLVRFDAVEVAKSVFPTDAPKRER